MARTRIPWTAVLLATLLLAGSVGWAQDGPGVIQVVAIDTHGKTPEYIAALKPLLERIQVLGPETKYKIYEATFAGERTGTVYVTVEFPSLAYMATTNTKTGADEEYARLLAAVAATGRTLRSNSILQDRTN